MIVGMLKTYCVCRAADREKLLEALRKLGVVHLSPVDPKTAFPDEQTVRAIDRIGRAIQVLSAISPAGAAPEVAPRQAADDVLEIQRLAHERQSRLATLHRQMEQMEIWGDVRLEQFEQLAEAGITPRFYNVDQEHLGDFRADLVHVVRDLGGKRLLVAVINRIGDVNIPAETVELPLPPRDRPQIRQEAAEIDSALRQDGDRLAQLSHLIPDMRQEQATLGEHAEWTMAQRGALAAGGLFAIQGWAPKDKAVAIVDGLSELGVDAAVETAPPAEDEHPPTEIRYPSWARPIKGLFDILGTLPGYREYDLSPFFMIAMPLFAAMLIGDAGYGLIFILLPLFFYRRAVQSAGRNMVHLGLVFGFATLVWGAISGTYFGISPETMISTSGVAGAIGGVLDKFQLLRGSEDHVRYMLIKISFIIGTIHLTLAHLRRAIAMLPSSPFLAEIGWCLFLWGMLGVIWSYLFFPEESPLIPYSGVIALLVSGTALPVLFAYPSKNVLKRVGIGIASFLLPALGAFSDTLSYIRLMAVGMASYYIAYAFNNLGQMVAEVAVWAWAIAAVVIVFGHLLNIGLAMIAIFAHGVRLNMLEFSNNAGVQWAGYPYNPFAKHLKEN